MERDVAVRLLDLTLPEGEALLLPRKRCQAIVEIELPAQYRRQDELREAMMTALDGRRPLIDFTDKTVAVIYLVSSANDMNRDQTTRFAYSVAQFTGADERAVQVAETAYFDTRDIDHMFTLPELQPEPYSDIKHL